MKFVVRSRAFWLVFMLLMVLAAVLRYWQLATKPGYDWDESVYTAIGGNVTDHGVLQAKTEYGSNTEPYLYHPPFYFLMLGGWFRLFGVGLTQGRALAATGSLLMLVILGLWLRRVIGDKWALLTVGVLAIDGWTVFTNRVGWIENTMMPLGIAGLWLYWKALQQPKLSRFLLAGAMLGAVAVYKHVGLYFLGAVLINWTLTRKEGRKHLALCGAVLTVIGGYVVGMGLWFGDAYWRESHVQIVRTLGLRESRGAITSFGDMVGPLTGQYKIFVLTLVLVVAAAVMLCVRLVQMIVRRNTKVVESRALLFAWAMASLLFFTAMQLKLPHYFIMVVVPTYCYLASELRELSFQRVAKVVTVVMVSVVVLGNAGAFYNRIVSRDDNALKRTAAWTTLHLPPNTKVITEESVGSIIGQPYCKIYRAGDCRDAKFLIVYYSSTQKPPSTIAVDHLLENSTKEISFAGFKERLTIYRINGR